MISICYKNPKRKVITVEVVPQISSVLDHNYHTMAKARADKINISKQEWIRRDKIVKEHAVACKFSFGDTFYPSSKTNYEKYGRCLVTAKVITYSEIDQDAWPATDNPFLITARSLRPDMDDYTYICTTNFLSRMEPTV